MPVPPSSPWPRISRLPRAELEELQRNALRRYVRQELYPFSAHYRRVFDAAGVKPTDIRDVGDLARLPLTTKKDLLEAQLDPARKRDFVLIPSAELVKRHWPLGKKLRLLLGGQAAKDELEYQYTPNFLTFTTGRSSDPVGFAYTPFDIEMLCEVGSRMLDVHAIEKQARILNVLPFAPHLAFWQTTLAGFRTGRLILPTGGGKVMGTAGNLRMAERMKPTVLIGVPGFAYHLLREAAEKKSDLSDLKLVILAAEKVTPGLKQKMAESLARCGAKDVVISGTYGFTEARSAFSECPAAHDQTPGYHLYPDLGLFEVIDPVSGKVLGEGETGELVYTPLARARNGRVPLPHRRPRRRRDHLGALPLVQAHRPAHPERAAPRERPEGRQPDQDQGHPGRSLAHRHRRLGHRGGRGVAGRAEEDPRRPARARRVRAAPVA